MPAIPRIILRIEERRNGATADLGIADLTLAACEAIDDGDRWNTEAVPATVEVCKAIPHAARMAAWDGCLFAPGLPEAFEDLQLFVMARAGGPAAFAFKLSVYQAAKRVVVHAEWLLSSVKAATAASWPSRGKYSHPLSGEIMSCSDMESLGGIPFAFGCRRLEFSGIDAASLADFLGDMSDPGAVNAYLETFLKAPGAWLKDVDMLEEAAYAWLAGQNLADLSGAIEAWNRRQDVAPVVGDPSILLLVPGADADNALGWCKRHLVKAEELVRAVAHVK